MSAVKWKRAKDWKDGIKLESLPEPIRSFAYVACPFFKGLVFWKIDVAEPVDIAKYLRKIKINAKKAKQESSQKAGNKKKAGK